MLSLSYYEKVQSSHNYERDGVFHKKYFMIHTVPFIILRWSGWGVSYYETPHSFHKKKHFMRGKDFYFMRHPNCLIIMRGAGCLIKCVERGQRNAIMNLWKRWGVSYYETPHSFHKKDYFMRGTGCFILWESSIFS